VLCFKGILQPLSKSIFPYCGDGDKVIFAASCTKVADGHLRFSDEKLRIIRPPPVHRSSSLSARCSRDPADSLAKLREDLKHFDESGHLVDGANVTEIKSILFRRIAELEAALQRTAELAPAALEQPIDKPTNNKEIP